MAAPSHPDPTSDPTPNAHPPDPHRTRAGARWLAGERHVQDSCGITWRVREMDTRGLPGARGERCLVFDSGRAMRRSWVVPDEWRTLGHDALLALVRDGCGPAD